jgi:hypothetical protein
MFTNRRMALPERPLQLTVSGRRREHALRVGLRRVVIAGWTSRDAVDAEEHIRELEGLGVARPLSFPVFYRVSTSRLTIDPVIEVSGDHSSGEVEFVLVQCERHLYVGVGSDHTDRKVETCSVEAAKQMCDKPLAGELWPFADVDEHWDALVLRSWAGVGPDRVLYQEGPVSAMRTPGDLIQQFTGGTTLPEGTVMFCGTLAALDGIRPAREFEFEIEDPVLGRRIRHSYDVVSLPAAR